MGSLNLENLKRNSKEILKAEIGALLFNLGKTHIGVWEKRGDKTYFSLDSEFKNQFLSKFGYNIFSGYRLYFGEEKFNRDLKLVGEKVQSLLMDTEIKLEIEGFHRDISINFKLGRVIKGDSEPSKHDFIKIIMFRGCENVNSEIDKGSPREQLLDFNLNIVNAFGSIKEKIADTERFDDSRIAFLKGVENKNLNFEENIISTRGYFLSKVKEWYSHLLSDTRFPINDITLWDQAYMTSSMFKAALAAICLDGKLYHKYYNVKNSPEIRWSILGIQYDKLGIAEKAMSSHFINWYRNMSVIVDEELKKLIEIDYALGNEIYRDETGIYFIVPENICGKKVDGDKKLYYLHENLMEIQNKILDCFKHFDGEVFPAIFLTKPSRGTMNIAYLFQNAKENFLHPIYPKDITGQNLFRGNSSELKNVICDVCRIRFAENEIKSRKLCRICSERRDQIQKNVVETRSNQETVFTGEIQDKNGSIALVTLKFELAEWLNSNMLNMMLRNVDIEDSKEKLMGNLKKDLKCLDKNSVLKKLVYKGDLRGETVREYCERILLERTIGDEWEDLLNRHLGDMINFNERKIGWEIVVQDSKALNFLAEILIQFIIRKNPSPARFRRIWESTEEFFIELEKDLCNIFQMQAGRDKRIKFHEIVDEFLRNKEFEYRGLNLISDNAGNLYLISSIEQAIPLLKNSSIENNSVYAEIAEGKTDWVNHKEILITDMEDQCSYSITLKNAEYIQYKPYISIIEPTPVSWQFIMPAEYVPQLIKEVQKRYDENFRYVKGKLPMHIGIVVQNYKKPLYIGVKALRNIRRDIYNWDSIKAQMTGKDLKAYLRGEDSNDENLKYYSLFQLSSTVNSDPKNIHRFYLPKQGQENLYLKTVNEAHENEQYYIYPNTIDFEFLDTNIRRNEISYGYEMDNENAKRIIELKKCRPYTWEEWRNFENFEKYFSSEERQEIGNSKLQSIVSLIYSKLSEWKAVQDEKELQKFILSAFINTFQLKDDKMRNEFAQMLGIENWSKLNGIPSGDFKILLYKFLDMYDFWHNCLKKI